MRIRYLLVLLCAACGDSGPGSGPDIALAIASVTPAPNATNVETGVVVAVTFNQPIDPTSVTPATFQVRFRGTAVPGRVEYDATTRTARAIVALLPDTVYEAQVTTGVRTPSGLTLSARQVWSFTTRPWEAVALDTVGTVGFQSSLVVDRNDRLHVTYADSYDSWDLKYATCATSCATAGNWQVVRVDTAGSVGQYSSLAADASGRLHVSYTHDGTGDLKYATCASNCAAASGWQTVTVDGELTQVGWFTSLAVDASGRLHVSYNDDSNGNLKYATCASSCATAANWQIAIVDPGGIGVQATSLAVDASGRLHVAYYDFTSRDLEYATCPAGCAVSANWRTVTVEAAGDVGRDASLAVESGGRVHIAYYDYGNADFRYATCATDCSTAGNWHVAFVYSVAEVRLYNSLTVDSHGRLHTAYNSDNLGVLTYATCAIGCATQLNWRARAIDFPYVGIDASIEVDRNGRIHTTYYDWANTNLKYIR